MALSYATVGVCTRMTDIGHIRNVHIDTTPGRTLEASPTRDQKPAAPTSNRLGVSEDRVEISDHARHLANIKAMPEVRMERIEAARAAIETGALDTDDALQNALEIMIAESELL